MQSGNRSFRSVMSLLIIETFIVVGWTCLTFLYFNKSSRSVWRTEFFVKKITLISWGRDVFLPSCMLSVVPICHELDLKLVGLLRTFYLSINFSFWCRATSPSESRATFEPNSLVHSYFNEIFDGGREDMYTFSFKTSPVFILPTFGIQKAGNVLEEWLHSIESDRISILS